MSSVDELYECYEIVSGGGGGASAEEKKKSYERILAGVSGADEKAKRLAAQFISRLFKEWPELYEEAFNKLLDLCEEESVAVRKAVVQVLPALAKDVKDYVGKVADVLTQMLVADDNSEILLIYSSLSSVLKLDFKVAMEAIFHQLLTQLEESNDLINTYAFKYLNEVLAAEIELKPEMETFVEESCKKLLTKLVKKEEYSVVIGILSSLKINSTLIGRQKLVNEITEQTKLFEKFDDSRKYAIMISNCKQTIKLLSKNVHADDLIMYLLENLTDLVKLTLDNADCKLFDLLKCIVDIINRGQNSEINNQVSSLDFSSEAGLKSLQNLFQIAFDQLPSIPEEMTEELITKLSEDKAKMSMQEVSLLPLYYLCKCRPEALTLNEDMLKDFKKKLQFLARINQSANKLSTESLSKINKKEQQNDETKEKLTFSRIITNLQLLVRELFKSSPSFKTVIIPSWDVVHVPEPLAIPMKRSNPSETQAGFPKTRALERNGNRRGRGRRY